MADSYVSEALADTILEAKKRAFATSKQLGDTIWLTLWRDTANDTTISVAPQRVLRIMANRVGRQIQEPAAGFTAVDGEFRKDPPFDVQRGDRFTMPDGASGQITQAPISGPVFISAPFSLER